MPVRIERKWYFIGSPCVIYPCPECGHELKNPVTDIASHDHCPHCEAEFAVPGGDEYDAWLNAKGKTAKQLDDKAWQKHVKERENRILRIEKQKARQIDDRKMRSYLESIEEQARLCEEAEEYRKATIYWMEACYVSLNGPDDPERRNKNSSGWDPMLSGSASNYATQIFLCSHQADLSPDETRSCFNLVAIDAKKKLKGQVTPAAAWKQLFAELKKQK